MILRKPYKFLIKNFKLIHLVMTLFMVFVIYKYNFVFSFFNTAISSYTGVIQADAVGKLYSLYIYLAILLIIICSLVMIGLLYFKKKPIKLYIATIIMYVIVMVLFAYSYNIVSDMQLKIIDLKMIRNMHDLLFAGYILQAITLILFTIRTIGLDITKFDFKNDLKEFEIEKDDNEEFELNVNIDINKAHRHLNKGKRYFGYFYKENRYLFFIISSISIAVLCMIIYLSMGVYNKEYQETEYFQTSEFMMSINNAYVTNKDYRGNILSDNKSLVILEVSIKKRFKGEIALNVARGELVVGNQKFFSTNLYKDKVLDIGTTYNNDLISNDFKKYLLVYEVPNKLLDEAMEFRYVDKDASVTKLESQTININITPRNLDKAKKTTEYSLGDKIDFKGSILGNTTFQLFTSYVLDKVTIKYDYCYNNQCYKSTEILTPSIMNNYDKSLLVIRGNISWDSEIASSKKENLFNFISVFGTFKYTINGVEKTDSTTLKQVVSNRRDMSDNSILEVIKEIINAEKLDLILNVRDYVYIYHLK